MKKGIVTKSSKTEKILLSVSGICKRIDNGEILKNISFEQPRFQKIAIAGETGSGKTTLLKIIGGLAQPDEGTVLFENENVLGPKDKLVPGHPHIAYLSQYFDLPKFLRVEQVLSYANTLSGRQATILYKICQIDHLLHRKTDELSGGEKQRIALARLLSTSPHLLLLDEPYSHLDIIHKNVLKSVIHDVGTKLKITCIMVSHEPLDTLSWADVLLVMKDGEIIQTGPPETIYQYPVNEYVAGLFGKYVILSSALKKHWKVNSAIARPEQFRLAKKPTARSRKGKVLSVQFFGGYYEAEIALGKHIIYIRTPLPLKSGEFTWVDFAR